MRSANTSLAAVLLPVLNYIRVSFYAKPELNPPWEVKEECGRGLDVFGRTLL